jgi:ribosomal protein L11 methyltransferase
MNWLEVSLTVDGELAESVAEVLARYAPNGVTTEQGVRFLNEEDEGTATGPITVRAYLEMDERIEATRLELEQSLFYLGMIRPLPAPVYTEIEDQNWMEAWKKNYKPIPVGERLVIVPAWLQSPDAQRIAIRIDPGMAFGTGTHPTTQLCLELIELVARSKPLTSVIDVGCGSGILSIAALKLGATQALGVDIDSESVKNSRENAELNGIADELTLGQGSVNELLEGRFGLRAAALVVANILAPIIIRLFDAGLHELVDAGGSLILSGILADQESRVAEAATAKGLTLGERRQTGDWVAMTCHRPEVPAEVKV